MSYLFEKFLRAFIEGKSMIYKDFWLPSILNCLVALTSQEVVYQPVVFLFGT